ncbi:hypothetical protein BFP70_12470 [Thioclava sp. SK-1]|uniref:four-carbon acid sugar kinase family protein n=1 Tax=Thioclava sp. SK-1 TaxID=1889770 RepID=UPI000824B51D|nr:four-carbon acid sugar kinase family protein [Thioclava sp. SK-1]OCX63035.1 hypothetical protein BFP70_12470 [Thioclava sp. SK-1]
MRLLIVADDLTGALDSAAMFAARGLHVVAARRPADLESARATGAQVIAVSTASREGTQDAAERKTQAVADWARKHKIPRVFKKIDSRLKGHPRAETQILRAPGQPVLICPAIPAQNRHVFAGYVRGAGVATPIPIAQVMGTQAQCPDAMTESDLDALVAQAGHALLVGAAGLAGALARQMSGRNTDLPKIAAGTRLFAIGSRDPITIAQTAHMIATHAADVILAPNGVADARPLNTELCIVQMVAGPDIVSPQRAGADFAATVQQLCAQPLALLLCSGGETADSIMELSGIGLIDVLGEALPGLPDCQIMLDGRPTRLITKSGGFGTPTCLAQIAAAP